MDPSQNPDQPLPAHHPQVTFAYTKHLWMSDRREEAYRYVLIFLCMFSVEKKVAMVSHVAICFIYEYTIMRVEYFSV